MHEMSVAESMVELVLQHAEEAGARRVSAIRVVVGGMSGIVEDSLQFAFEALSEGTLAQGAILEMKLVPTKARCKDCCAEFLLAEFHWSCEACGGSRLDIIEGKELYVDSIEVE